MNHKTVSSVLILFTAGLLLGGADRADAWTLVATADDHGQISPAGTIDVVDGGSTNCLITADAYYSISEVLTNGSPVSPLAATNRLLFTWDPVVTDSFLHGRFAANLATNGVPEWWLAQWGWTNRFDAAATNDSDEDGVATWLEYYGATDPTNSESYLHFNSIAADTGSGLAVSWMAGDDLFYGIDYTSNLPAGTFDSITQNISASTAGPLVSMTVAPPGPDGAYRLRVQTEPPSKAYGWTVGNNTNGYGMILHTEDSGYTWTRQGRPGEIADVILFGVAAVDRETAWVVGLPDSGYATIYQTTNTGATWSRFGSAATLPNVPLNKVRTLGSQTVWITGANGTILATTNNGAAWTNYVLPEYASIDLQGLAVADSNTIWVSGRTPGGYATILHTTNGGQDWVRQTNGAVTNVTAGILGISAVSPETAWAVGGPGYRILHTTNGGALWEEQFTFSAKDANEVVAVNSSEVWVACDSVIYWTTNGGTDWLNHGSADYTMGLDVVDSQSVWTVSMGTPGIRHTPDRGAHWVKQHLPNTPTPFLWTVSFAK